MHHPPSGWRDPRDVETHPLARVHSSCPLRGAEAQSPRVGDLGVAPDCGGPPPLVRLTTQALSGQDALRLTRKPKAPSSRLFLNARCQEWRRYLRDRYPRARDAETDQRGPPP